MLFKKDNNIFLLLLPVLLFMSGCSRSEPVSPNSGAEVKKISPVSVYQLDISEPSGIAYNSAGNTLLIVSDSKPEVFEVNLAGVIIRTINVNGSDMEGVAVSSGGDTIYIVEERLRQVSLFNRAGAKLASFKADVAQLDNSGLEGVAVKRNGKSIFVINEKDPKMLLYYENYTETWRKSFEYAADLSDICYEDSSGFLWVISDESGMILRLSETGILIDKWEIPFSKGEGIAVVGDKLYIVNDQDGKMYVFRRPSYF